MLSSSYWHASLEENELFLRAGTDASWFDSRDTTLTFSALFMNMLRLMNSFL